MASKSPRHHCQPTPTYSALLTTSETVSEQASEVPVVLLPQVRFIFRLFGLLLDGAWIAFLLERKGCANDTFKDGKVICVVVGVRGYGTEDVY